MAHLAPVQINKRRRLMLALPPPPTPTAKTLVKTLVSLSKAVSSSAKPKVCQNRNATNIVRRIELLTALFEEIRDSDRPVPPSAVIAFRELHGLMQRVCLLLEECAERSTFWLLMEQETYGQCFHELTQSLGTTLSSLPLDLLALTEEVMEQTVLVRAQVQRARLSLNPVELQLREDVLNMLKRVEMKRKPLILEFVRLFYSLQLLNAADCETEIHRLEEISMEEDRKDDLKTQQGLASLISFVRYGKYLLYSGNFEEVEDDESTSSRNGTETVVEPTNKRDEDVPMLSPPAEFLCPITLDLMRDPVIVATGQTYDRASIAKWIQAGHSTCPKTGQRLTHNNLISNYALRSLISQWCEDNNVPFENEGMRRFSGKKGASIQHVTSTGAALEAMKLTATFLVEKLATGNEHVQKQVARELRLLSKAGADNRICIAEAGGIPLLLPLLSSSDAKMQEHAVTTLLNLSIVDGNKTEIVAAGALDLIIEVLTFGHTLEARENAAATLFSLSVSDEVKVQIGSKFDAIPSLVTLLREGSVQRGKKDAASALFNLAVYHGNKAKIIAAGAVPTLVAFLADESATVADACAAVLALLATLPEGIDAIRDAAAISVLVSLLRHGTPKGREYATSVLLAMCRTRDKMITDEIFQQQNHVIPCLYNLLTSGTVRAKRKATSLLRLLRSLEPVESYSHQHILRTRLPSH